MISMQLLNEEWRDVNNATTLNVGTEGIEYDYWPEKSEVVEMKADDIDVTVERGAEGREQRHNSKRTPQEVCDGHRLRADDIIMATDELKVQVEQVCGTW